MALNIKLHHSRQKADWLYIPQNRHNVWQHTASVTGGWLTPANLVSLTGAVIACIGLVILAKDAAWIGVILLAIGRLADVADGFVAQKTGTRSPLGETIDASLDKVVVLVALICLAVSQLVPIWVIGLIALQNLFNAGISLAGRIKRREIHPNREGKLSTAAAWIILTAYPIYNLLGTHQTLKGLLLVIIFTSLGAFIIWGSQATHDYHRQFRKLSR